MLSQAKLVLRSRYESLFETEPKCITVAGVAADWLAVARTTFNELLNV